MLQLCYGMGLRVSEIVNLKLEDICSETMRVRIENAKGKKTVWCLCLKVFCLNLEPTIESINLKVSI